MVEHRFFDRKRDIFLRCQLRCHRFEGPQSFCQWSLEMGVQFVLPRVRVTKTRFGNRPFANNQMHKGYTQIAESMISVVPNHLLVQALDEDGLVVVRNGSIWIHHLGDLISESELSEIDWVCQNAFSDSVLLDHKPLYCSIGAEAYQFHNWMDFGGSKGIREKSWYDETLLLQEEEKFMMYLKQRFSSL